MIVSMGHSHFEVVVWEMIGIVVIKDCLKDLLVFVICKVYFNVFQKGFKWKDLIARRHEH